MKKPSFKIDRRLHGSYVAQMTDALKDAISEYMNSTKWTDAHFAINERIQCKLFFAIKE